MPTTKTTRTFIGTAPVDSGQLIVVDPCYLDRWIANEFDIDAFHDGRVADPADFDYNRACHATCGPKQGGRVGSGVAVASGGDGCFPVYLVEHASGRREIVIRLS